MTKERNPTPEESEQIKRQFIPKREPLFYGRNYEEVIKKKYQGRTIVDGSDINAMREGSEEWYEMINDREKLEEFEKSKRK